MSQQVNTGNGTTTRENLQAYYETQILPYELMAQAIYKQSEIIIELQAQAQVLKKKEAEIREMLPEDENVERRTNILNGIKDRNAFMEQALKVKQKYYEGVYISHHKARLQQIFLKYNQVATSRILKQGRNNFFMGLQTGILQQLKESMDTENPLFPLVQEYLMRYDKIKKQGQ